MNVFNDLKTRGVNYILIAVTDGLKGMAGALGTVFPATTLQTCIVEGSQGASSGYQAGLHSNQCRGRLAELEAFEESDVEGIWSFRHGCGLETGLGKGDSVLRLPGAHPAGDLHHLHIRECQRLATQEHQDTRALPN